jgi:hypothetical protein
MQELNTFEFPSEIQKELEHLMNSRDNFLKKISSADAHKLRELYAQLNDAWNQNLTWKLKQDLDRQLNELDKTRETLKNSFNTLKPRVIKKFKANLKLKNEALKNEENEYALKTKKFADWRLKLKKDLTIKFQNSIKRKESLNHELKMNLEARELVDLQLLPEKEKLKMKSEELNILLNQKKQASLNLITSERPFLMNLEEKTKKLNELRQNWLQELRREMLVEISNCPDELQKLWLSGELSTITLKTTQLLSDITKRGDALTRELTKIGQTKEQFLKRMERFE